MRESDHYKSKADKLEVVETKTFFYILYLLADKNRIKKHIIM